MDYIGLCFRCGVGDHLARTCRAPPSCKICLADGKPADHRLGSNQCSANKIGGRTKEIAGNNNEIGRIATQGSEINQGAGPSSARGAKNMDIKILQANFNRSRQALDLLLQHTKEFGVGLLLISEPNFVPESRNWFVSRDGGAAIYCELNIWRARCHLALQGNGFVAVQCGPYLFVSVYISPNISLREFNSFLDNLSAACMNRVDKIVINGDFNAKSKLWGSRLTDSKGALLSSWTAERDLRILNVGSTPTCVRPQGSSVIDVTWSSPELVPLIKNWRVLEEVELLSDHLYVAFTLGTCWPRPYINKSITRR